MKKLVNKILNHFGYHRFELPSGSKVSEADILEMFSGYGEHEVFTRFLRDIAAQDIRFYYQASTDKDRDTIRGAHDRSYYFLSLIKKAHERQNKKGRRV